VGLLLVPARNNSERNLNGVGINVKILFSWLQVGGVESIEVSEFVVGKKAAMYGPYEATA
jgi:hypothetical protein